MNMSAIKNLSTQKIYILRGGPKLLARKVGMKF